MIVMPSASASLTEGEWRSANGTETISELLPQDLADVSEVQWQGGIELVEDVMRRGRTGKCSSVVLKKSIDGSNTDH